MTEKQRQNLAKYKKSNKAYKAQLLVKWGFSSQEEYFKAIKHSPGRKTVLKTVIKARKTKVKPVSDETSALDYVIAFDTTGSMNSYIEAVKTHVRELIGNLFKNSPDLRMKIVAFGDYCDMETSTKFGKAYQTIEFTTDQNALINFVNGAQNTSGGDGDEFYELVIKKINEESNWRTGVKKSVLFIADCDPHKLGYTYGSYVRNNQIDWRVEARRAAELGIQYDTLKILGDKYPWYKELSQITGGASMDFQSASKTSSIIEGTVYARTSKAAFARSYGSTMSSGDSELIGAYKTMCSTITDFDLDKK